MTRRVLLLIASLVLAAAWSAGPALAQYGGASGTLVVKDTSGTTTSSFTAGQGGSLHATGLESDTAYNLDFSQSPPVVIGTGTSDSSGVVDIAFTIPSTAHVGAATLTLLPQGATSGGSSSTIQIVAGAGLPKTGRNIEMLVGWGLLLIAIGTGLIVFVRTRRSRTRSESRETVSTGTAT